LCLFTFATEKPNNPHSLKDAASETPLLRDSVRLTTGEWAPYISEHRPHFGLAAHIVTEAFKLEGVRIEFGFFSWKRAFAQAKVGRWDGSMVWGHKGDRENFFYISDPIINEKTVFSYLREKDFKWSKYQDLRGLSIGLTKSYQYSDEFQAAIKQKTFSTQVANQDILNFKKLLKRRIDLFPIDHVVAQDLLQNYFSPDDQLKIAFHPKPIHEGTQHLLLSKQNASNKTLIKRFNEGLMRLKASGRYQQIMKDFKRGAYAGQKPTNP